MQVKRTLLVSAVVVGALALVGVGLQVSDPGIFCSTEFKRINSVGSDVYFLLKVNRCSAIDGTVKIYTVRKSTGNEDLILFVPEDANIDGKFVAKTEFEVTLPNLVYLSKQEYWSQGVHISYKFTPVDAPEQRAKYRFYVEHPNDPRAIAWASEHYAVRHVPARSDHE